MLETQWKAIISGDRKGFGPSMTRLGLWFLSLFYLLGLSLKKAAFALGIRKPVSFNARIVSVGNITVGGTGKTPVTEELAKRAVKEGRNVLIVSRGYKRKKNAAIEVVSDGNEMFLTSRVAGDEPFILARRIKGAKVLVTDNKAKGITYGVNRFKPEIVFLDDGFQRRDEIAGAMHVVLLDALNPWVS